MRLKILPVILLAAAIALSPSYFAGKIEEGRIIEIRVEDILLVFLGLGWIIYVLVSGKTNIRKPPLFFPICAWLSVGLLGVLLNLPLGNIALTRGFFYFLKEVEFFLIYFYVFYHLKNIDSAKLLLKVWVLLILVNVGWVVYETVAHLKLTYYYGPTAFIEPEGTLPSGGFFLVAFTYFLNLFLYHWSSLKISRLKKIFLAIMAISPAFGIFASGSRASFWGFAVATLLTLVIYFFKKASVKTFFISVFSLLFILLIFISAYQALPSIRRIVLTFSPESRVWLWGVQMEIFSQHPWSLLFGMGKSVYLYTEESHNQYVRNLIETGIIGSLLFFALVFGIIRKSFRWLSGNNDSFSNGLAAGLFVITLSLLGVAITAEVFIVVKVMEIYWFFAAITMAVLVLRKQENVSSIQS